MSVVDLVDATTDGTVVLDEQAKREVRRAALAAVCIPGHQVLFGSREMPVARGWGTGGLQVTLAIGGPDDRVRVIDQGDEEGVNAVNLRRLIVGAVGCEGVADQREATITQSRHRIPEEAMTDAQTLVLQVPVSEPLRVVERNIAECDRMHAEADYSAMWVAVYENLVNTGVVQAAAGYPVMVNHRFLMAPSPIPRWDVPRLHMADNLTLLCHGRDKKLYAVPPHTHVEPVTFDDVPFEVEHEPGSTCELCGADDTYLVPTRTGGWLCSDVEWCHRVRDDDADLAAHRERSPLQYLPDPSARVRATARDLAEARVEHAPAASMTAPGEEWTLKVDGLGMVYPPRPGATRVVAAEDVSFDVAPGEALGIVGESGSGKSTVLRCIIGDERATGGAVHLASFDAGRTNLVDVDASVRRALRISDLSVVYQHPSAGLNLNVSAGANIAARLTAAGWRRFHDIRHRAAALLNRVEVPLSRMDDVCAHFSGGMQQRVQIAKALATDPQVLLLDEPTTGLDASLAAGVLDLLRELIAERDIAVVVVSHDFSVIESLTDRALVMHRGRVVEAGLTDQLFADPHHPYTQRLVAAARA